MKFGPAIARNLRRGRSVAHDRWHLDEMVVSIAGRGMYMWRAVDSEGEVLDMLVQPRRDKAAALKLLRKLLKRQGFAPTVIVTDKLRYPTAPLCRLLDSPAGTTRVCAPTTGPKIHISQYAEESARCRVSNRPARPSASSLSTPPFTTSSTSSDISSLVPLSTASVLPLIALGTTRPLRLKSGRTRPNCVRLVLTCQASQPHGRHSKYIHARLMERTRPVT
jgi:DDE superfamily endonuclease